MCNFGLIIFCCTLLLFFFVNNGYTINVKNILKKFNVLYIAN